VIQISHLQNQKSASGRLARAFSVIPFSRSASIYGLYVMAGNVWQRIGDIYEGVRYRFMRGSSKDTYEMDNASWYARCG